MANASLGGLGKKIEGIWRVSRPNAIARMESEGTLIEEIAAVEAEACDWHESLFKRGISPSEAESIWMNDLVYIPDEGDDSFED